MDLLRERINRESLTHEEGYLHFRDENNNLISVKVTMKYDEYEKLIGHQCKYKLVSVSYCH